MAGEPTRLIATKALDLQNKYPRIGFALDNCLLSSHDFPWPPKLIMQPEYSMLFIKLKLELGNEATHN